MPGSLEQVEGRREKFAKQKNMHFQRLRVYRRIFNNYSILFMKYFMLYLIDKVFS
jgi:hypothetical protein